MRGRSIGRTIQGGGGHPVLCREQRMVRRRIESKTQGVLPGRPCHLQKIILTHIDRHSEPEMVVVAATGVHRNLSHRAIERSFGIRMACLAPVTFSRLYGQQSIGRSRCEQEVILITATINLHGRIVGGESSISPGGSIRHS